MMLTISEEEFVQMKKTFFQWEDGKWKIRLLVSLVLVA
jgi:hypothetical protein